MANEGIGGVLAEVETLAEKAAATRGNTNGNVLAALSACAIAAKHATAESARDMALCFMAELASTIAEADRMSAEVVAQVGK